MDIDPADEDFHSDHNFEPNQSYDQSNSKTVPLLIFFDIETTGFSIYDEHIIELAAKVVGVHKSGISQVSFSSLVYTSRNIPKIGKKTESLNFRSKLIIITISSLQLSV